MFRYKNVRFQTVKDEILLAPLLQCFIQQRIFQTVKDEILLRANLIWGEHAKFQTVKDEILQNG